MNMRNRNTTPESLIPEAIEAYTQTEVAPVLSKLDITLPTAELVRRTLQEFGKRQ